MADLTQVEIRSTAKIRELEEISKAAEKLDITVTFALKTKQLATYRIVSKRAASYFDCQRVGMKRRTFHKDLDIAIKSLTAEVVIENMVALAVRATKCEVGNRDLRRLAIEAWCEGVNIDAPAEASLSKAVETAQGKQQSMREALISDLRGPDGVHRFEMRKVAEVELAKHLKEADLSQLDLSGISFANCGLTEFQESNFEGSRLTNVNFMHCNVSECNFRHAIMDGAKLITANAIMADFSGSSLVKASLRSARLANANFADANLSGADLSFADLRGVNLSSANLDCVQFSNTEYDEKTRWPSDFVPPKETHASQYAHAHNPLVFRGYGRDPLLAQQVRAMAPGGNLDFATFVSRLEKEFDKERLKKALKMLKAESFQLFGEVKSESVAGIVKSQRDPELFYSCRLADNGTYACCTQNLNSCGGLRGALCKHLLVLVIGLTKGGELDAASACEWVLASRRKDPKLNKDIMSNIFLRYKGAEAGELDWRPTETMPEDYYAF